MFELDKHHEPEYLEDQTALGMAQQALIEDAANRAGSLATNNPAVIKLARAAGERDARRKIQIITDAKASLVRRVLTIETIVEAS